MAHPVKLISVGVRLAVGESALAVIYSTARLDYTQPAVGRTKVPSSDWFAGRPVVPAFVRMTFSG